MKPWLAVMLAAAILALGVSGGMYLLGLRQGVYRNDSPYDRAVSLEAFSKELARLKANRKPARSGGLVRPDYGDNLTLEEQAFLSAFPSFYRTVHPEWATPAAIGIFIFSAGVAGGLLLGGFGLGVSRRRA